MRRRKVSGVYLPGRRRVSGVYHLPGVERGSGVSLSVKEENVWCLPTRRGGECLVSTYP
jgi:hypothetical protein